MKFKIFLVISSTLLSFCQPQASEVINEDNRIPIVTFNCNNIESDNPYVLLNVSIVSFNEKIFNISIKGQGTARDYYRQISDIEANSTYESEFVFQPDESGTYSFQLYIETLSDIQIKECTNSLSLNTTTTTTRPTTTTTRPTTTTTRPTTTTTRPTTTTTTLPTVNIASVLVSDTSYEETLPGCENDRTTLKVKFFNNSNYSLQFQFETSIIGSSFVVKNNEIIRPNSSLVFSDSFETYDTTFTWRYKIKYENQDWSTFIYSSGYRACFSIVLEDFEELNEEWYTKRLFRDRPDNPFICEYPGKGYREGRNWGRCITWKQWYEFPNMEKADSNWIQYCWKETVYSEPYQQCNY